MIYNSIYQDTVREVNNDQIQEVNNDLVFEVNNDLLCEVNNDPVRAVNNDPVCEVNNDPVREVNNDQMREVNTFKWGNEGSVNITKYICDAYEKIVFWRKNIFMLPTGSIGKKYVLETTKLLNAWTSNSPMKDIAFKAIHIMPSLLLQKPSKTSKAKDHTKAFERRMELWWNGDINALVFEAETIQNRMKTVNSARDISQISKQFVMMMEKGNVNGALKVLTNNMSNGTMKH